MTHARHPLAAALAAAAASALYAADQGGGEQAELAAEVVFALLRAAGHDGDFWLDEDSDDDGTLRVYVDDGSVLRVDEAGVVRPEQA